jgi:hypothetical protein
MHDKYIVLFIKLDTTNTEPPNKLITHLRIVEGYDRLHDT